MSPLQQLAAASLLALLATRGIGAETNGFVRQMLTLPGKNAPSLFADLDNEGRADFLVVDMAARRLLIYRQRAWGFTNAPDQTIELPPQTAWIAPCQVETNKGRDLLVSTATGVIYYRQTGGVFESEPHTLIKAAQVFANDDPPLLLAPLTNGAIPVISATEARLYRRNDAAEWTPEPPLALAGRTNNFYAYRNAWIMGANSSFSLKVSESARVAPAAAKVDDKPENEAIAKLIAEMKKAGPWNQPHIIHMDLNRDGQTDFIVWQVIGEIDYKTDIYVFLRGADGRLPEKPTQALHCRGFPIPVGATETASPIGDLKGDGTCELVLLEPKFAAASVSSLVDMALSHGVDMALTVRQFNHGAFARSADASVPLTVVLSWYGSSQWPFCIGGDFNGDGRPDLLVQHSSARWDIFPSTDDGHWFKSQPAMQFEMPTERYFARRSFDLNDLNGDGRSDIVLRDQDDARIFIYLTQPSRTKGNP